MDQRAAQAELLFHAAGKLRGRPLEKRLEARCFRQQRDPLPTLPPCEAEQLPEERQVLRNAQFAVEVLAETLRHVGDPRADPATLVANAEVAAEDSEFAGLELPRAGQQGQQGRFADAVRSDKADGRPCRNVEIDRLERRHLLVGMAEPANASDRPGAIDVLGIQHHTLTTSAHSDPAA